MIAAQVIIFSDVLLDILGMVVEQDYFYFENPIYIRDILYRLTSDSKKRAEVAQSALCAARNNFYMKDIIKNVFVEMGLLGQ